MKILLAIILFSNLSFAQISNDQINVNVLGGSISLSGTSNVTLSTGSNVIGSISNTSFGISGSLPAGSNAIGSITNTIFGATQSGAWNVGRTWALQSSTDSTSAIITSMPAITGSVSIIGTPTIANTAFGISGTLPAFASTPTFNVGTGAFVDRTTAAAPYANRLTDGTAFYDARSIRALTSSDVVTIANPTTSVSITGTPTVSVTSSALPTGAATSANQTTELSTLSTIATNTANTTVTQATGTNLHTVIDSGAVTATISGTPTVTTNAGTNTSTASLNLETTQAAMSAKLPATLGAKTTANSMAVNIASDQTVNVAATGTVTANIGTSGSLATDTSVNTLLKPASTLAAVTTVGTVTSVTAIANALPAGTNSIGTVQAPTITKGTQGATGFMTQELLNSGRVIKSYSATFTSATTEALVSLTPIADGVAGTAATSFTVTAGKRLRLTQMCLTTRNAAAAGQGLIANLRMINTGAVTATSPLTGTIAAGTSLAVANITAGNCATFQDGLELSGTMQFGVSQVGTATANNNLIVYGFEY